MDGLFGLCRKKKAGISMRPPLFGNLFFEDQQKVDAYVNNYNASDKMTDKVFS